MKIAAALGRLKAEAIPRGDFGSAPLSEKEITEVIVQLTFQELCYD